MKTLIIIMVPFIVSACATVSRIDIKDTQTPARNQQQFASDSTVCVSWSRRSGAGDAYENCMEGLGYKFNYVYE